MTAMMGIIMLLLSGLVVAFILPAPVPPAHAAAIVQPAPASTLSTTSALSSKLLQETSQGDIFGGSTADLSMSELLDNSARALSKACVHIVDACAVPASQFRARISTCTATRA